MLSQFRFGVGRHEISISCSTLTGVDTQTFLQKQSTLNINNLEIQSFHLISFLDPQGRIEFYGWLLRKIDSFKILVPSNLEKIAFERLNRFLISEDVDISPFETKSWFLFIGPKSKSLKLQDSFSGEIFNEIAYISENENSENVPEIDEDDFNLWMGLTGYPSFTAKNFEKEIINNTLLYELSVSLNKGCYPGQETVSKIATRRGAAYAPVLLEIPRRLDGGEIFSFEQKIGVIFEVYEWNNKYYALTKILRDFRVDGLKINFQINNQNLNGIVRYFPLIKYSLRDKAEELFSKGSAYFQKDDFQNAEHCMRLAIEIDPSYQDGYEGLGVMLGRLERFDEAIKLMDELLKVDQSSVMAHTNKSLFLMKLGKIEEAETEKSNATIKSFQQYGKIAKENENRKIEEERKISEWAKRESMFKQVLDIDPDDTLAHFGLGSVEIERKNWTQAVFHFEKVLAADSTYSVAYLSLGKSYKELGRTTEAVDTWKKGIEVAAKKGELMPANQMQAELDRI